MAGPILRVVRANTDGYICVDVHEAHLEVRQLLSEGPQGWYGGRPSLPHAVSTLRGWLEDWVWSADSKP